MPEGKKMEQYTTYVICLIVGYLVCHIRSQMKEHVRISSSAKKITLTTNNGKGTCTYIIDDASLTPCIPLKLHDPKAGFSCMCHTCMQ